MIDAFFEALGYRKKETLESSAGIDPNYEYAKTRYEGYLRDRQAYLKESLAISDRFDKSILALSGGSLALSLTFIEKIAPSPLDWSLWFLLVAWLLLILSVLFGIYALAASQMAIQREIAHLDQSYREFLEAYEAGDVYAIPNSLPYGNRAVRVTQRLNVLSMVCLGVGIFSLCIFSLINLHSKTGANPQVLQVQLQIPPSVSPSVPLGPPLGLPGSPLQQAKPIVPSVSQTPKADDHEQQTKPAK
jgi:hypothetical protein